MSVLLTILNFMSYLIAVMCIVCVYIICRVLYETHQHIKRHGFWYLYLDDERELPHHYDRERRWFVCRSSEEAKQMVLKNGIPAFMSLDHDLGGEDTTMKFLHWLAEEYYNDTDKNPAGKLLVIPGYVIHSQNPIGAQNIKSFIESWKKIYNENNK